MLPVEVGVRGEEIVFSQVTRLYRERRGILGSVARFGQAVPTRGQKNGQGEQPRDHRGQYLYSDLMRQVKGAQKQGRSHLKEAVDLGLDGVLGEEEEARQGDDEEKTTRILFSLEEKGDDHQRRWAKKEKGQQQGCRPLLRCRSSLQKTCSRKLHGKPAARIVQEDQEESGEGEERRAGREEKPPSPFPLVEGKNGQAQDEAE